MIINAKSKINILIVLTEIYLTSQKWSLGYNIKRKIKNHISTERPLFSKVYLTK